MEAEIEFEENKNAILSHKYINFVIEEFGEYTFEIIFDKNEKEKYEYKFTIQTR